LDFGKKELKPDGSLLRATL